MNLILFTKSNRQNDKLYCLDDYRADHIINILKSNPGDNLDVGLLNSGFGTGTIEEITNKRVIIRCDSLKPPEKLTPEIDLICALPRPQTLKKVLFISGMMGIRRLFLIRANRVEKSYYHSPLLEEENRSKHLFEGMMQGKNVICPEVEIFDRFKKFFEDSFPALFDDEYLKLLPDLDTAIKLKTTYDKNRSKIVIAIGPEGGWVPFETEMMEQYGFTKCKLGNWILRVEHAVMAALAQIEALKDK